MTCIADSLHVSTIHIVQVSALQGFPSILGGIVVGWLGDQLGGAGPTPARC
jgi:hypothetical protein